VVVDGVPGRCWDEVRALRLTDPGAAFAVVRDQGKSRLARGDEAGPPFDEITGLTVTDDGGRTAYAAALGRRWRAVLDGSAGPEADAVRSLRFGDRGRRSAYVSVSGEGARVVLDGIPGPAHRLVGALATAADGPRVAYAAEDEGGAFVVVDGERSARCSAVLDLALSADGRHVAWLARREGRFAVVYDGRERPVEAPLAGSLVLSARGERWALLAGDAASRTFVVLVDGAPALPASAEDVFGDERDPRPWLAALLATAPGERAEGRER
jgi:predicted DCC family thiol-disulfide oxidoreductase YuxK